MPHRHVAIVMPAYNEADGLESFIAEIIEHLALVVKSLTIVVVNDRSTDGTGELLERLSGELANFVAITSVRNQGHGPTALAAYRAGLEVGPDTIVHVDGDGQFLGHDIARVLSAHERLAVDVVHGIRRNRTDPWYRKVVTCVVGVVVSMVVGSRVPDGNTPLRVYSPDALRYLLGLVPDRSLVPHIHFSLAEKRSRMRLAYAEVTSIPRRGASSHGTMWGATKRTPVLPPKRLRTFIVSAAQEVWAVSLRTRASAKRAGAFRP